MNFTMAGLFASAKEHYVVTGLAVGAAAYGGYKLYEHTQTPDAP